MRRMLRRALACVYGGGEPERPPVLRVAADRCLGDVAVGDQGVVAVVTAAEEAAAAWRACSREWRPAAESRGEKLKTLLPPVLSTAPADRGGVGDMTLGSGSTTLGCKDVWAESGVAGYALAGRALAGE